MTGSAYRGPYVALDRIQADNANEERVFRQGISLWEAMECDYAKGEGTTLALVVNHR